MSNTQSLNRYSYVLNNPLSYTDPSGHFFFGVSVVASLFISKHVYHWAQNNPKQAIMIASIAAGAGAYSWVMSTTWASGTAGATVGAGVAAGAASGATSGGLTAAYQGTSITSGITRGGATGAVAGGFSAIGGKFGIVGAGVGGGLASKTQGGDFRSGFVSATVSTGMGWYAGKTSYGRALQSTQAGKVVLAATIGGTASDLSGGDFANGARTAAFAAMMRESSYAGGSAGDDSVPDSSLSHAANTDKRRFSKLSPQEFNELMSPLGYKGGENQMNVEIAKQYILEELDYIAVTGVRNQLMATDPLIEGSKFGIGLASQIRPVLGPVSIFFSITDISTWVPAFNNTSYTFYYGCSSSYCSVEGYTKQ